MVMPPYAVCVVTYVVAAFINNNSIRLILWVIPLLVLLFCMPLMIIYGRSTGFFRKHRMTSVPFAIEHLTERFGLFTIVVSPSTLPLPCSLGSGR